jgi:Lar family restriction alleviation protein
MELKPCPFCGGKAESWVEFIPYWDGVGFEEKNLWHCGCKSCGIFTTFVWLKDIAIEAWNRRVDNG